MRTNVRNNPFSRGAYAKRVIYSSSTLDLRASWFWYGTISTLFQTRLDSYNNKKFTSQNTYANYWHGIFDRSSTFGKAEKKAFASVASIALSLGVWQTCMFDLYSHLPFSLCAFHAKFRVPSSKPTLIPFLYPPPPRIVILRLWGSLLISTVCRGFTTPYLFQYHLILPNANPAYLSPVWTVDVSLLFSFLIASSDE